MGKFLGYTELGNYWQCPRRFAWAYTGWRRSVIDPYMLRGSMTHAAIAGYLRGGDPRAGVAAIIRDTFDWSSHNPGLELPDVAALAKQAIAYYELWQGKLSAGLGNPALAVETRITAKLNEITLAGTPDAVLMVDGKPSILEIKTTAQKASVADLDLTGQADYYAWLAQAHYKLQTLPWVALDVITEDYAFRHHRPARAQQGLYLAASIAAVTRRLSLGEDFRKSPSYGYWCGRCPYKEPCKTVDRGGDELGALAEHCHQEEVAA